MSIKFFKLIDLLNRRGITKEELRLKIGASSTTIAKLSSNKNVSLDVIDKICKALDCQPGDIMEYEDDEKL
ncbi:MULTISPECIES: helix-turn-helix domain-containing protein [Clostridioides]|uniref:helix-turn-helix domain-containing protein n=1 Tax=Clostridioides TaxID=1870884 RepID=UPI0002D4169D|nr:helix-turn-helix transcriptional regulator [Clostridioides difficile]EGT4186879.1 XRE family transcriptional regulator [Clostridioides difficile]EGT4206079.1 XRE family transcriptional regulator [Clostridioides difficile]EGT4571170.1 XRE family transcriptional regulator [Clostridioides difficile]EGT4861523.1 XRE family transcriptional regulator [Clostridioides difficile]EII6811637.1 helix-turn-helix transcriptional regulator [Clostridioides difficile]